MARAPADALGRGAQGSAPGDGRAPTVRLGLIVAPGPAEELGRRLAADLPDLLRDRVGAGISWEVPVVVDDLAGAGYAGGTSLIDAGRRRMLDASWDFAVVITDLPLRIGHRPVVADASATHRVALLSLPALGARQLRRRAAEAIVRLVDGLVGESTELDRAEDSEQRRRVRRRLAQLASTTRPVQPDDDDVDLRFVAAVVRGNLRMLAGMVRANRPWRLIVRLSRALVAAGASVVLALVTSDIWRLSDALGWVRLSLLTIASMTGIVIFLIVAHGLWERTSDPRRREQAVLFNVATTATLTLGVLALYAGLLTFTLLGAALTLDRGVMSAAMGHHAGLGNYLRLAWMASSLATIAGALGSGLESDAAVREAAYGYRPERETERDCSAADAP